VVVGVILGWVIFGVRSSSSHSGAASSSTGACTLPHGTITYQDLQCHAEAHLDYPGAKVYQTLGASQTTNIIEGGINPAFSGAILISSAPVTTIYAWYDTWLTAHGWYRAPLLGAGYVSSHGYARTPGMESFDVDIDNPSQLSTTLGQEVPAGGTIFEVTYLVEPYRAGATPGPSCAPTPEPSGLLSSFYCNP
jgi:hypothetical protein